MTRAIQRGLQAAVAVMLLAVAGAALFPESEGERFATTAYLAAIFAAMLLGVWRCLPQAERSRSTRGETSGPAIVAFWVVVAGALAASVVEAGSLAGELLVAIVCAIAVIVAALFPSGLFAPLHREITKDGNLLTVTRYAILLGVAGWVVAATVPAANASAAPLGFVMLVVAFALIIAALRPLRDIIGATVLTVVLAFAVAACAPSIAQTAAEVGYVAALVAGLLVVRAHYA